MQVFIVLLVLTVGIGLAIASPTKSLRIVGGSPASVSDYREVAALLYAATGTNFRQTCGGTIVSYSVILTAARCIYGDSSDRWRIRVGSSFANSGGVIYGLVATMIHSDFDYASYDSDLALMYTSDPIQSSTYMRIATLALESYNLADNEVVWAIGWGQTAANEALSEQLRDIQIWVVNQAVCRARYDVVGSVITDNMLCAGWLNVGGRDQCLGDAGSPLYHKGVVVGVCSWGRGCGDPNYPGVNTRVSRYGSWIVNNSFR